MIPVTEARSGQIIKLEGHLYKIVHLAISGSGQVGRSVQMRLKELSTGALTERRFRAEERLEETVLERVPMEYLYEDQGLFYFMNLQNYEQYSLSRAVIGHAAAYLKPNAQIQAELQEGRLIHVILPETAEATVVRTAPGLKDGSGAMKEAVLDNGVTVLVPQFVKEGDRVRVNIETGHYLDRLTEEKEKGKEKRPPDRRERKSS
jgi:elongation factor P